MAGNSRETGTLTGPLGNISGLISGILATVKDSVSLTDLEGNILMVSRATLAMHGFEDESELLGKSCFILFDESEHTRALANLRKTIENGRVDNIEYMLKKKDGSLFPALLSAALLHDSAGAPTAFIATVKDMSQSRQVEKELKDKVQDMEAFGHIVAHDLKTPLISIMEFSKLMLEQTWERLDDPERDIMGRIVACSRDSLAMIDDLRKFFLTDRDDEEYEEVSLTPVISQVMASLEGKKLLTEGRKIHLQPGIPPFAARPTVIYHIFSNLLENALKFGSTEIFITGETGNNRHVFHVRDNGWGIESYFLEKAFDIFSRSPKARKTSQGTGIGLALVKRLLIKNNGRIWVESKEGEGSTFSFEFPVVDAGTGI